MPGMEGTPLVGRYNDEDMSVKHMLIRSETLLRDLRAQRETELSRQCELLNGIKDELASDKTPLHMLSAAFFQWLLVATGFVFGLFAIQGTGLQNQGNFLSLMQSQLNMVQFCQTYNSSIYSHPCDQILENAPATIAWLADQAFPNSSLGAVWPWPFDNLGQFKLPGTWYSWTIPPLVTGLIAIVLTWRMYQTRFGRKKSSNLQSSSSGPEVKRG